MQKIKLKRYPTISVVIATYNSHNTLDLCLSSVRKQDYPQKKIEIIIADGGSKDDTPKIAKRFGCSVFRVPAKLQNAEYNKGVGLSHAEGELVLMIDHDNVLPSDQWMKEMVNPLLEDKTLVASETLRYRYDRSYSLLDRYFALFGAGDPLAYYLGKADRLSYISDNYDLMGKSVNKGRFYRVVFDSRRIPTLGANGFLIRRKTLQENAQVNPKDFFHIDVNVDLIRKGYNRYAFVKNDIIHLTGYNKISKFLYRRKLFMEQFYGKKMTNRRYSVYEKKDFGRLVLFIIYAGTIIKPSIDAIRGYLRVRDIAWFFHPVLSFVLLVIYGYTTLKGLVVKN